MGGRDRLRRDGRARSPTATPPPVTDTGHVGNTAAFAPGHPEKMVDMGYRAIHEMTLKGKAVTDAYYGSAPKLSFFNGCSQGGRQALTEAMRYPTDYNGIIGGAPAIYNMQIHVARIGINAMANRTPASNIPSEKYQMVHDAVHECVRRARRRQGRRARKSDELQVRSEGPRVQRGRRPVVSHCSAGRNDAAAVRADETR